jgi:hypothetical protein
MVGVMKSMLKLRSHKPEFPFMPHFDPPTLTAFAQLLLGAAALVAALRHRKLPED